MDRTFPRARLRLNSSPEESALSGEESMTSLLIVVLCVAVFWACWKALDVLHKV